MCYQLSRTAQDEVFVVQPACQEFKKNAVGLKKMVRKFDSQKVVFIG